MRADRERTWKARPNPSHPSQSGLLRAGVFESETGTGDDNGCTAEEMARDLVPSARLVMTAAHRIDPVSPGAGRPPSLGLPLDDRVGRHQRDGCAASVGEHTGGPRTVLWEGRSPGGALAFSATRLCQVRRASSPGTCSSSLGPRDPASRGRDDRKAVLDGPVEEMPQPLDRPISTDAPAARGLRTSAPSHADMLDVRGGHGVDRLRLKPDGRALRSWDLRPADPRQVRFHELPAALTAALAADVLGEVAIGDVAQRQPHLGRRSAPRALRPVERSLTNRGPNPIAPGDRLGLQAARKAFERHRLALATDSGAANRAGGAGGDGGEHESGQDRTRS